MARQHNKHVSTFNIENEATDYQVELQKAINGNNQTDFKGFNMNSENNNKQKDNVFVVLNWQQMFCRFTIVLTPFVPVGISIFNIL